MTDDPKPDDLARAMVYRYAGACFSANLESRTPDEDCEKAEAALIAEISAALERLTKELAETRLQALASDTQAHENYARAEAAESREREAVAERDEWAGKCMSESERADESERLHGLCGAWKEYYRLTAEAAERARDEAVAQAQDALWGLDHALAATMKERDEAVAERDRLRAVLEQTEAEAILEFVMHEGVNDGTKAVADTEGGSVERSEIERAGRRPPVPAASTEDQEMTPILNVLQQSTAAAMKIEELRHLSGLSTGAFDLELDRLVAEGLVTRQSVNEDGRNHVSGYIDVFIVKTLRFGAGEQPGRPDSPAAAAEPKRSE